MKSILAILALTGAANAFELFGGRACVASCYAEAVNKVGCGNKPASCYCTKNQPKKRKQVSEAFGQCVFSSCGTAIFFQPEEFTNNLCRPEKTKSTCGPKKSCPEDQTCMTFSKNRKHCAVEKTPCESEADCNYRNGERCLKGHCYAVAGLKKQGEACSDLQCDDKLLCDFGTCKSVAECEKTSDCVSGLDCFSKTCRGPGLEGEECLGSLDCSGGLVCTNGKCGDREYKPPGAPCSSFLECGSAECTKDGVCGEYFDGKCTNDSDCGAGNWCYDVPGGTRCCPMNTPSTDSCRVTRA